MTTELQPLLKPWVEEAGYELWGVVFHPHTNHSQLCVYIESPHGITLDDCEKVSRVLSDRLDELDPIPGGYTLEVSSPGLDRPLFTVEQYQRYLGKLVKIDMRLAVDGQRHFKGRLINATAETVIVHDKNKNQEVILSLKGIKRAHLIPEF